MLSELLMRVKNSSGTEYFNKMDLGNPWWLGQVRKLDTLPEGSYRGSVLLPNGTCLILPRNKIAEGTNNKFHLFDPKSEDFETLEFEATGNYRGGVLLPTNEVLCIPKGNTHAALYDAVTGKFTELTDFIGTFIGGVVMPTGEVLCIPYAMSKAGIYNPRTRELRLLDFAGTYYGGIANNDCSKIVLVPFKNGSDIAIYDPVKETFRTIPGTDKKWCSGCLLPNNKAFMVSGGDNPSVIYDFDTDRITPTCIPKGVTFRGAKLLPNGNVFCFAKDGATPGIYDWREDKWCPAKDTANFINGQILPDGRVLALPKETPLEQPTIYGESIFPECDPPYTDIMALLISPWFNKY